MSLEERLAAHPQLKDHVLGLLKIAESDIESADEAEERTIEGVRGLGKQVLEEWARHQEQTHSEAVQAEASTRRHEKKLHWLSTFGEIDIEERTFVQAEHLVRPFSAHAGVQCRSYSGPLQRRITDFGAEKSFAKAARQLKEHYGLEVSVSAIRLITQDHGERLLKAPQIIQGAANAGEVAQLIAETDGTMIPKVEVDENATDDRRKTRQVGWKEARLSLVYAKGSVQPVFGVTTGSPEQAGAQLVEDKDAPVRACHRYISNRADQFDYPHALAAELPIGSGEIESAHRYVIQERLKIPGAWWKVENADKMLALRTMRANGNWDSAKAA